MAQAFTKKLLSGSTNGRGIKVAATSGTGTLLHTAIAGTSSFDEIWLWAYNSHTADVELTIQWGGTTAPDDETKVTIPFKSGQILVIDGRLLQNSLVVRAYAATTNVIQIHGYANQIV
jgi:hypothetical protein